jgi:cytochrome c biogenesis protein CcmG/thiol:disulfide interchange protein DsbE
VNQKHRTLIIILAVVGLVAVAAATAFLLSSGDDETDSTGSSSGGQSTEASGAPRSGPVVAETQPVEVVGTPLPMLDDPANDPAVGLEMPVIEGKRFDGSAITIGGPSDGPTMYVFLAHWCPHCNDEIPELIELNDGGDIPVELNVIGVSTAVAPDGDNYPPSQWIVDKGWPWDVMADDDVATAFVSSGGSGFPYTVLVDADGIVIARAAGNRPADAIKAWIDAGLATVSA